MADPRYHTPSKIVILLGAEVYGQDIKEGLIKRSPRSILAENSALGWILSGQLPKKSHCHNAVISMHSQLKDNDLLKRFWVIESGIFSNKRRFTEEEQQCGEFFAQTTTRSSSGRYIVRLPFYDLELPKYTRYVALKNFVFLKIDLRRILNSNRIIKLLRKNISILDTWWLSQQKQISNETMQCIYQTTQSFAMIS